MDDLSSLYDRLETCGALSLDVFDTALLRCVAAPTDVFRLVAKWAASEDSGCADFDFEVARVLAEKRARAIAHRRNGHTEVTFAEVYASLLLPPGWDRSRAAEMELAIERALSVVNPFAHALYARAIERGIPVVFVSDMYLSSATIEGLLRDAGYDAHTRLFVSAEYAGASKANGKLYEIVARELDLRPDEVLHVGDNRHADYAGALQAGFDAWHYRSVAELAAREKPTASRGSVGASVISGLVHNASWAARGATGNRAWLEGFAALGPFLAYHHGDEATALGLLRHFTGGQRWLARLAEEPEMLAGAHVFHNELAALCSALPWLSISAIDAASSLGDPGTMVGSVVERSDLAGAERRIAECLVAALAERNSKLAPSPHDGQVEALTRDLHIFRRRFAPPDSLRTRALDWSLRRARLLARAADAVFDVRDAVLDHFRLAR